MTKYMPGPWHLGSRSKYYQHISSDRFDEGSGMHGWIDFCRVVVRMENGGADDETAQCGLANARLIAAAPELLEALRDALAAMEHMGDVMNGMDIVTDEDEAHFPAFAKARSAIAKAEGRS